MHYEVEFIRNGESHFMIIRCACVERVIPIFRSIHPEATLITMREL